MQKRETNKRTVRKKTGERISGKIHNVFPQETASVNQSCGSVILIIHHLSEAGFAVSSGPHFCQCPGSGLGFLPVWGVTMAISGAQAFSKNET